MKKILLSAFLVSSVLVMSSAFADLSKCTYAEEMYYCPNGVSTSDSIANLKHNMYFCGGANGWQSGNWVAEKPGLTVCQANRDTKK